MTDSAPNNADMGYKYLRALLDGVPADKARAIAAAARAGVPAGALQ